MSPTGREPMCGATGAESLVELLIAAYARDSNDLRQGLYLVIAHQHSISEAARLSGAARSTLRRHVPLCRKFARRGLRRADGIILARLGESGRGS